MAAMDTDTGTARIEWLENGEQRSARWRSESGWPAPRKVVIADDSMNADTAYRLALDGTALLWRGDFQNARQLLQALMRRVDHKGGRKKESMRRAKPAATLTEQFHRHRLAQLQRARTLAMLLIPFEGDYTIPLRRAPEVHEACLEAYGPGSEAFVDQDQQHRERTGALQLRQAVAVELFGGRAWRFWFLALVLKATHQRLQQLARVLVVAAPQQSGAVERKAKGDVRGHRVVGDDDLLRRRPAALGMPGGRAFLAVFDPVDARIHQWW